MQGLMKKKSFLIWMVLYCFGVARSGFAEELTTTGALDSETFTVHLEPRDADCLKNKQIEIGKIFCAALTIKGSNQAMLKDLSLQSFDAVMPEHRHGMVTRPKIRDSKTGEYLIEGLKLHMPGEWRFAIKLVRGKSTAQVAIPLKL